MGSAHAALAPAGSSRADARCRPALQLMPGCRPVLQPMPGCRPVLQPMPGCRPVLQLSVLGLGSSRMGGHSTVGLGLVRCLSPGEGQMAAEQPHKAGPPVEWHPGWDAWRPPRPHRSNGIPGGTDRGHRGLHRSIGLQRSSTRPRWQGARRRSPVSCVNDLSLTPRCRRPPCPWRDHPSPAAGPPWPPPAGSGLRSPIAPAHSRGARSSPPCPGASAASP